MATAADTKEEMTLATKNRHGGEEADAMLATAGALVVLLCHVVIMSRRGYYN